MLQMDLDGYDLLVVDAMHKANFASRLCHSCTPNCATKVTCVDGQYMIGLYAIEDIKPGDELTFNYHSVTEVRRTKEGSLCALYPRAATLSSLFSSVCLAFLGISCARAVRYKNGRFGGKPTEKSSCEGQNQLAVSSGRQLPLFESESTDLCANFRSLCKLQYVIEEPVRVLLRAGQWAICIRIPRGTLTEPHVVVLIISPF